jgi:hypothetical protein
LPILPVCHLGAIDPKRIERDLVPRFLKDISIM